jgi:hypothetical protein
MRLRATPPSIRMWYSLNMFLGQFEASNAIDISIHLWWGTAHDTGAAATTAQRSVSMTHLDVMS